MKRDIKKFEEYDSFDFSSINQIKYRKQVEFLVDAKYAPVNVTIGANGTSSDGMKLMNYPT